MDAPRFTCLVGAMILALPISLLAQGEEAQVGPGDRVRVTAPAVGSERLIGRLAEIRADAWLLEVEGHSETVALPIASVTSLEVYRGTGSKSRLGAQIGAVAGLAWCANRTTECPGCLNTGELSFAFAMCFAGGAGIGALIGSTFKVDQWETVPLDRIRVTVAPQRMGELAVCFAVRL